MDSSNVSLVVQQGENILASMKDLKNAAKKKGKARFDLYERFSANIHSYYVYTLTDSKIEESPEVIAFLEKLDQFQEYYKNVGIDFDCTVDIRNAAIAYDNVLSAFNEMVTALGLPDRKINAKKF
ncbi:MULTISPECIES: hypothetical protein [Rummeliibacillus]|uniref:hypothetical protein n=1 Tax=Rummeliibacillus TaxID=648802 RepID=UPI0011B7B4A3|nr:MULTISPECIES: hypothetical protein [Rummeliibacillus]MBO2535890.1 hypothetical protein [Rummeliibacillus suwonensis]